MDQESIDYGDRSGFRFEVVPVDGFDTEAIERDYKAFSLTPPSVGADPKQRPAFNKAHEALKAFVLAEGRERANFGYAYGEAKAGKAVDGVLRQMRRLLASYEALDHMESTVLAHIAANGFTLSHPGGKYNKYIRPTGIVGGLSPVLWQYLFDQGPTSLKPKRVRHRPVEMNKKALLAEFVRIWTRTMNRAPSRSENIGGFIAFFEAVIDAVDVSVDVNAVPIRPDAFKWVSQQPAKPWQRRVSLKDEKANLKKGLKSTIVEARMSSTERSKK